MQVEPKITGFRQRIFVDSWRQAFSINTAIHDHLVSDLVSVTPELPNAMLRSSWEQVEGMGVKTIFGRPRPDFRKFPDLLPVPNQQLVRRSYPHLRRKTCAIDSTVLNQVRIGRFCRVDAHGVRYAPAMLIISLIFQIGTFCKWARCKSSPKSMASDKEFSSFFALCYFSADCLPYLSSGRSDGRDLNATKKHSQETLGACSRRGDTNHFRQIKS